MNNILREKKSYAFVTSLFTLLECELFEMPHQVILMSHANGCILVMNQNELRQMQTKGGV